MGCSDVEAVAAPEGVGGAGGGRAYQGGDAGCAVVTTLRRRRPLPTEERRRWGAQDFETVCLIGQGSAALVYLVRCRRTGKMSALKVQRKADHKRCAGRVQMEREVMVDARHPLVAPLYLAFQDSFYLYLNMEYCPGGSLDNFVRYFVKRNLTEDEARFYAAEITLGLEFLHSKGLVYRDLKAANVLVARSGHIKLTDFGIAERGKVKIETEDKMYPESPLRKSPSLSRTQSTPRLQQVPHSMPRSPPRLFARKSVGPGQAVPLPTAGARSVFPEPSQDASVPLSPPESAIRSHTSGVRSRRGNSQSPDRNSTSPSGAARPDPSPEPSRSLSFLRRKRQATVAASSLSASFPPSTLSPLATAATTSAATVVKTPPRPPSLRTRLRDRLRSSPRKPDRQEAMCSSLHPELYSLPGPVAAKAASIPSDGAGLSAAASKGPVRKGGLLSSKSLHHKRKGSEAAREDRSKLDRGRGLPPSGPPEGSSPQDYLRDRSLSPPASAVRQATVTLAEASWCLLAGSPEYMAPEVLMHAAQGSAVDWWGLGVLTYELILGRTPFVGKGAKTRFTYLNIMHKEAQFPEAPVDTGGYEEGGNEMNATNPEVVSDVCKEFIRALLTKDPRGRAGSRGTHAVKAHPFFAMISWGELRAQEPPLLPSRLGMGNERGPFPRPPPVTNTSGWTWDAEVAVEQAAAAAEEEAFFEEAGGKNNVFNRFDWVSDDGDEEIGVGGDMDGKLSARSGRDRKGGLRAHDIELREIGLRVPVDALADLSGQHSPPMF